MPTYKPVRLEEGVYNELVRRKIGMESLSETLWRLMTNMDEALGHSQALLQVLQRSTKCLTQDQSPH